MNFRNIVIIVLLVTFTFAANNAFAQSDSPKDKKTQKELKEQERNNATVETQENKDRQQDANALKKEFKLRAKEAKRVSNEASDASKQAKKSAKLEKKAQKSRIKATKQKEKADKAVKKSDLN